MESVEKWKETEEKDVEVVKREERMDEMEVHMSKRSAFTINGQTIRCSEGFQSWFIDKELTSV